MRTSSYTIYVDLPEGGETLLVHGYSGAHDKVSRKVADFLRASEKGTAAKAPPLAPATLERLAKRGYLTSRSVEEEHAFLLTLAGKIGARERRGTPSFLFMPTYDCNLRCAYCYQSGLFPAREAGAARVPMTTAMLDRLFAALPAIEARHGFTPSEKAPRSIGFYGGEPFLRENRAIVGAIVERALALAPTRFAAVTNGSELDAFEELLGPGKISTIQITLDGPAAVHDARRVHADGSGSFEAIARNVTLALDRGVEVGLRIHVDRGSLDRLPELAEDAVRRGWTEPPRKLRPTIVPIDAMNETTPKESVVSRRELETRLAELRARHPVLARFPVREERLADRVRGVLDGRADALAELRTTFCGAHTGMYVLDPRGDVYACWERTAAPGERIGRVLDGGVFVPEEETHREWRSRTIASNPVCSRCKYALHCGGGCAARALDERGSVNAPHCDEFAARFSAGVREAYLAKAAAENRSH